MVTGWAEINASTWYYLDKNGDDGHRLGRDQ